MPFPSILKRRRLLISVGVLVAGWITLTNPPGTPSLAAAIRAVSWVLVMVAPGFSLYLLAARREPRVGEALLSGFALSPVMVVIASALLMLSGVSSEATALAIVVAAVGAALAPLLVSRAPFSAVRRRDAIVFISFVAVLVTLTALLPFSREWWRVRSDAWFHAAVVAQIDHSGLPPEDPYFAGMPLQYMWCYHTLVLVLSRVLHLDSFWPMAMVNVHALVALALAAFCLAGVFRDRFAHRFAATATLLLAFNAAFWILLPVKLGKAMRGDVRGWEEIRRTYALHPFSYDRACDFMNIYYNQEFFLDKFMVATAFGLALAFMTAAWFALASFLKERRESSLILLAGSLLGMLGFHSLVGFVNLVAIFGGSILTLALRRGAVYRVRDFVVVLGISLVCFLVSTPYLYTVMHLKEREQVFPLSISWPKTAGIAISSAFVLVVAARQRRFWTDPAPAVRFYACALLSLTLFCLVIALPGPNTYDKLGYFVFVPLSIVAGFGVADSILERSGRRRWLVALAWAALFYLPVNAIAFAGCFVTHDEVTVTNDEARLSAWVRDHTPRDALIIDDGDRVVMLVTAPRRYYWGSLAYAWQWGYPKLEMSRRLHARRALYATGALDATALGALGSVADPLYVVVRAEHRAAGAAVTRRPDLFKTVYDDGSLALVRVDTNACREAAAHQSDTVSPEELIRESGL